MAAKTNRAKRGGVKIAGRFVVEYVSFFCKQKQLAGYPTPFVVVDACLYCENAILQPLNKQGEIALKCRFKPEEYLVKIKGEGLF